MCVCDPRSQGLSWVGGLPPLVWEWWGGLGWQDRVCGGQPPAVVAARRPWGWCQVRRESRVCNGVAPRCRGRRGAGAVTPCWRWRVNGEARVPSRRWAPWLSVGSEVGSDLF